LFCPDVFPKTYELIIEIKAFISVEVIATEVASKFMEI
tara:strand:+ start:111 stop:224 length:114 start_codon:yes stop_codon:yes gene_type:complete